MRGNINILGFHHSSGSWLGRGEGGAVGRGGPLRSPSKGSYQELTSGLLLRRRMDIYLPGSTFRIGACVPGKWLVRGRSSGGRGQASPSAALCSLNPVRS